MAVLIFILGSIIGSFLNVVIYRLPRELRFAWGHSQCPHCNLRLAWYDLLPIISFIVLRGRCRACSKRISWVYPLIEALSGLIFVGAYMVFGLANPASLIVSIVMLECFVVLAVIDLEHFIIPDGLLVFMLGVSLASGAHHIYSALVAGACFFAIWGISRGRWMGFGDVKLAVILGLFFGFPGTLLVIYGAVLIGGILGATLVLSGKANLKTALPFGTILAISSLLFVLFEPQIMQRVGFYLVL